VYSRKLSVRESSLPYLLEIEGLCAQVSRPARTVGEAVGGIFEMDSSDWSNGIRYHTFDTKSDTEFKTPFYDVASSICRCLPSS